MAPLYCAPQLQAIVGSEPMPRTEIVSGLWAYIKKHKLQDNVNKRMVNCDEKLKALFGKSEVSMFEMAGLVGKSAGPKPFTDAATAPAASTSTKTKKKTTAAAAKAGISQALKDAATKDACAAALGCKVRVKATHETHAGKEGILGPSMGDSWHITFSGDAGKNTGRVNRDDFIVIQNPAQAAWPFPTAHKP